jgi:hypothetical protein
VRALNSVGADQYRPGAEYPLHFQGLGQAVSVSSAGQGGPSGKGQANATPSGQSKSSIFSSLSQAASSIPGFGKTPAAATPTAGKTGAAGQAAGGAKGNTAVNTASQIASSFAGGQPGQTTGTGVVTQAANLIPAFSSGTPSSVATAATSLIPGFSTTPGQNSAAATPAPGAAARATTLPVVTPAVVAPPVDPCANKPHCFNAGAFAAEVTQVIGAETPKGYTVRTQIVFMNPSTQPVVLGYVPNSASAADNLGNRYTTSMIGAVEAGVTGILPVNAAQGGRFVLGPHQQRAVGLVLVRPATVSSAVGSAFNVNMQVGELSAPTGPATLLRQQPVSLANVTCICAAVPAAVSAPASAPANSPANALRNAIRKR